MPFSSHFVGENREVGHQQIAFLCQTSTTVTKLVLFFSWQTLMSRRRMTGMWT